MAWNSSMVLDALRSSDLLEIGILANQIRLNLHPENVVTYELRGMATSLEEASREAERQRWVVADTAPVVATPPSPSVGMPDDEVADVEGPPSFPPAELIPDAPATIVRTKRSWPGTSTSDICRPEGRVRGAYPSAIEIPRSRSSGRRSVSTPVSARTNAVLPWSM